MSIRKLINPEIQEIYNKYVAVNYNRAYLNKYVPLPMELNTKDWPWEGKDFPRIISLLEFRQYMIQYDKVFDSVASFGSITDRGMYDPEYYYLKYKDHKDFDYHFTQDWNLQFLNLDKKDWDFVMINQVIEHLYNPILGLKNIYDHMKVGGMFYANVPVVNIPHDTPFHYYTGITPIGLGVMVESAGFEILKIGQWGNKRYLQQLFDTLEWPDYRYSEVPGENDINYPVITWCLAIKR